MNGKILIIHPEGNVNNNPNLTGIIEILCRQGYYVEIISPRVPAISQKSPCPGAALRLIDVPDVLSAIVFPFVAPAPLLSNPDLLTDYLHKTFQPFNLVIGVDRGIIDASLISRALRVPLGLVSYEIYSAEETSRDFKALEIEACRGLSFAVCQDKTRSSLLGRENEIPANVIFDIPVAGRGFVQPVRGPRTLHERFNLSRETKIAAYIGSVTFPWSMIGELLNTLPYWPPDWVLLLHHRYGSNQLQGLLRQFPFMARSNKICISPHQQLDFKDLPLILNEVDIGLAFYRHKEYDPVVGNNLKYIGMASGKISTYLQHGIPIMINDLWPWNHMIKSFDIGWVIHNPSDIPRLLGTLAREKIEEYKMNIPGFFSSYLDLNITIQPLLERIHQLIQ